MKRKIKTACCRRNGENYPTAEYTSNENIFSLSQIGVQNRTQNGYTNTRNMSTPSSENHIGRPSCESQIGPAPYDNLAFSVNDNFAHTSNRGQNTQVLDSLQLPLYETLGRNDPNTQNVSNENALDTVSQGPAVCNRFSTGYVRNIHPPPYERPAPYDNSTFGFSDDFAHNSNTVQDSQVLQSSRSLPLHSHPLESLPPPYESIVENDPQTQNVSNENALNTISQQVAVHEGPTPAYTLDMEPPPYHSHSTAARNPTFTSIDNFAQSRNDMEHERLPPPYECIRYSDPRTQNLCSENASNILVVSQGPAREITQSGYNLNVHSQSCTSPSGRETQV